MLIAIKHLHLSILDYLQVQWDPCNQDTLGQSSRVLIIGVSLFWGLCTLDWNLWT